MHRLRTPEEKPDTPELLDQIHVALRKMLIGKQIDELVYAKNIIALASRWLILGMTEDATAMISELTDEYLTIDLPQQMMADENFRVVALAVADALESVQVDLDSDDVAIATLLIERPVAKA